jgi:hypothetical protein
MIHNATPIATIPFDLTKGATESTLQAERDELVSDSFIRSFRRNRCTPGSSSPIQVFPFTIFVARSQYQSIVVVLGIIAVIDFS